MDFNDFMSGFNSDEPNRPSWIEDNGHTEVIRHLVEGIEGDHINARQLVEALYTLMHPDISPQGIDILPLFAAAAHGMEMPSITDFFHGMHIIHVPGAFAVLCSVHAKVDCPCGNPPTRPLEDATDFERKAIDKCMAICLKAVIPDDVEIEAPGDGPITSSMVRIRSKDTKDNPELTDRLVASFRQELDNELPTVVPPHERNNEPGGSDWMKRWT